MTCREWPVSQEQGVTGTGLSEAGGRRMGNSTYTSVKSFNELLKGKCWLV